ncbi:MAG: hypothetical protein AAGJ29_12510 [Pseudomonadota bacterium]
MFDDLVKHVETETGLTQTNARAALGIVLNAAERQDSPFASELFSKLPGARTASATAGAETGAATGEIARLIERTPGGRRFVMTEMFRHLQATGLGHSEISQILPAISSFAANELKLAQFGHLGDLIGTNLDVNGNPVDQTAAA